MIIPNKVNVVCNAVMPDGRRLADGAESNAVGTEILTYSLQKLLKSDKASVAKGETVRNTAIFTNNSAAALRDCFFKAPLPEGAVFIDGSVKINGAAQPSPNPAKGFYLPDLPSGGEVVIEYDIKAEKFAKVAEIAQTATLDYRVNDPARGDVSYSEGTNTVFVTVTADGDAAKAPLQPEGYTVRRVFYKLDYFYDCCGCCCCDCCDCCDDVCC